MSSPQAGWYQDPQNPQGLRYWDGAQWTSQTHQPTPPPPPPSLGSYQASPQAPGVASYQGYSQPQQGSYAASPVSFLEAAKSLFTKWTFRGRASRSEYWFAYLAVILLQFISNVVTSAVGNDVLSLILNIVVIVTGVNLLLKSIRRYHDTGRSGWWLLPQVALQAILLISLIVIFFGAWFAAAGGSASDANSFGVAALVVAALFLANSVWMLVWLSLPGKTEKNRFDN